MALSSHIPKNITSHNDIALSEKVDLEISNEISATITYETARNTPETAKGKCEGIHEASFTIQDCNEDGTIDVPFTNVSERSDKVEIENSETTFRDETMTHETARNPPETAEEKCEGVHGASFTIEDCNEDSMFDVPLTNVSERSDQVGIGDSEATSKKLQSSEDKKLMKDQERLPDGGWGWVVVFGASLILVLVDSVSQCFGIIFSRFLIELEASTAMTAWIFNLLSFIWCMTGPPLGPLLNEFGWRTLCFIGSFLLTMATVTSAFASAAWVLFFTYSLLAGLGCGIISNISYMIVPHYFTKRRGIANGIIMAWDCGGQLIGPPLINMLQDEYTFKGATLILGGIIFNCCIGAAVFHPVEWHMRPGTVVKCEPSSTTQSKEKNPDESSYKMLLRLLNSTKKDLAILKSFRAVIIALGATFIFSGYLNFLALVPFAIQEAGHPLGEAAFCVSISAICNMITRVAVSALSDSKIFNYQTSMVIGSLTISGTMICFTFVQNLTVLKIIMGVWGCGVGTFMSIFNLVMVHYMGLDNFIAMMGATMFCLAFGYITIGPLSGYIRDITQSYAVCMAFLAGMVFLAFILWLFMPLAVAYDLHQDEKHGFKESRPTRDSPTGKDVAKL